MPMAFVISCQSISSRNSGAWNRSLAMNQQYIRAEKSSMQACQIQKIYTTQLFICMAIREPGKTQWWWIGRQKPFCGIWKDDKGPEGKYRGTDVATEWLRARLKGSWIVLPEHYDD